MLIHIHFPTAETVSIKNTILGYTPSPSIQSTAVELDFIIATGISCGFFLMIVILVATVLLLLSKRLQLKRVQGNNIIIVIILVTVNLSLDEVTDHIPVEDNPVYITMKKIDMNKNSAYETVELENINTCNFNSRYKTTCSHTSYS